MTETLDDTAIRRYPQAVWEFFRAISGLVTVCVLAAVVIGTTSAIADEPSGTKAQSFTYAPDSPNPPSRVSSPSRQDAIVIFYLVRTPGQASLADWGETEHSFELRDRSYHILYARDDAEMLLAGQTIVGHAVALAGKASIHVVDLRPVEAAR